MFCSAKSTITASGSLPCTSWNANYKGPRPQRSGARKVLSWGTQSTEGYRVEPTSLRIQRLVGQGSFGEVFEGICLDDQDTHRVIMKRVKSKTAGAEEMGENEHLLNVYVKKHAAGSCAEFFGYTVVQKKDRVPDKRITQGKWLLWKYQGLKTLRDYLSRKDCLTALAVDLRVPEHIVVQTVIYQILQSVQKLHAAGLVHRDVKPSNIILCEEDLTFRLIDLGAMADLRTGLNYTPSESILDPYYCPPEQYVLPTDAPDLAKNSRVMSLAMSAMLWRRHKPDRFDMYSIGLILLQLAIPQLRMKSGLQNFHTSYKRCRYDLSRWRTISSLTAQQTAVLDANNGCGWVLAECLLRPRKVQVLSDGHVYFTNDGSVRPSAEQAMQYDFLAPASQTNLSPVRMGSDGSWMGLFSLVQNRVSDLEEDIIKTAQQAEETSTTIQKLQIQVQAGEASEAELAQAEGMLANLTGSLSYLQGEMKVALKGARRAFRQGFGEESESEIEIPALTPHEEYEQQKRLQANAAASTSDSGSHASRSIPQATGSEWTLAGAMLSGLQSMGRVARMSGDVVDRINADAQAAIQHKANLNAAEENFIAMLEQASVRASAQWTDVSKHFSGDPRYNAVPEDQRFFLFRNYIRMQQDMNALKLDDAEKEYMRRLSERVTTSKTAWRSVKQSWAREVFFRAVEPSAAETLFARHIAKLQQDEAAEAKKRAGEMVLRSALETLDPPVSPRCQWADVKDRVEEEVDFRHLSDDQRFAVFEEVRSEAEAAEAQAQAAAAQEAARLLAEHEAQEQLEQEKAIMAAAEKEAKELEERNLLEKLRQEQAQLKAEYERMERKLREMESKLQGSQSEGVRTGAVIAERDVVSSNGASRNGAS